MFEWLKKLMTGLIQAVREFLAIAFPIAKQLVIAALKDYAVYIVATLATTDLSNGEKREEAWKAIVGAGKDKGIVVGESLARVIAELAYQIVKDKFDTVYPDKAEGIEG